MLELNKESVFNVFLNISECGIKNTSANIVFKKGLLIQISFKTKKSIFGIDWKKIPKIYAINSLYSFVLGEISLQKQSWNLTKGMECVLLAKWALVGPSRRTRHFIKDFKWEKFEISHIALTLTNLISWLCPNVPHEYSKREKFIKQKPSQIDVTCSYLNRQAHIYDSYHLNQEGPHANSYILEPFASINIDTDSNSDPFTFEELIKICADMRWLFTSITGKTTLTTKVQLNNHVIFYEAGYFDIREISAPYYFLLRNNILQEKKAFQTLFENFCSKRDLFFDSYPYLWESVRQENPYLQSSDFLQLFSMLDRTISIKFPPKASPLNIAQERKIINSVKQTIKKINIDTKKKHPKKPLIDKDTIELVCQAISKNNCWTYRQKIKYLLKFAIPQSLCKIIDLDPFLVNLLVVSRNKLAHADKLPDKFSQNAGKLYYKVLLLTFILVWSDLGLDETIIIKSLYYHEGLLKSYANRYYLGLMNREMDFQLSEEEFNKITSTPYGTDLISKQPVYDQIILEKIGKKYTVNSEKLSLFHKGQKRAKQPTEILEQLGYKNIKSFHKIWISCNKKHISISNLYVGEI